MLASTAIVDGYRSVISEQRYNHVKRRALCWVFVPTGRDQVLHRRRSLVGTRQGGPLATCSIPGYCVWTAALKFTRHMSVGLFTSRKLILCAGVSKLM